MAALAGFEVITGDQLKIKNYADLFPRGIYIDKSVAATRTELFKRLSHIGHRVISWDEEGLLFFSAEMYKELRLDAEALNYVDLFFCWGDVQKNTILKWFPDDEKKLRVCGNPRADLMRKDYRSFYQKNVDRLKTKYGKIILINTNFAFCNHYKSPEELREMLEAYPLASEKGYIDGWVKYQQDGFDTFCTIIPKIAKSYPQYTLIIRPHPSENHQTWQKIADKNSNIVVNAEGNVHEWIMASEVLLHDNCTTAVEAFILDVPALSYRIDEGDGKYVNFLPDALSCKVKNDKALFKVLGKVLVHDEEFRKNIWSKERKQVLEQYISGLSGKTSVESMLSHIVENLELNVEKTSFSKSVERICKKAWRKRLHMFRDFRTPPDGYTKQKFPGLSHEEVVSTLSSFNEFFGNKQSFKVKRILPDVFSIRSV
jgi:surface carbohydrate biosynthesis protein